MTILQAIILGIVQGLTEFLPISSSAHLVVIPYLLGWDIPVSQAFVFDVLVQLGTLAAVIIFFRRDLWAIVSEWVYGLFHRSPFGTANSRMGWYLILATIPAGLLGITFKSKVEAVFSNPLFTASLLYGTAILLVVAEKIGKRNRSIDSMNWKDALWVGVFQAISIFPGISRSGSTISGGMTRNLDRPSATRFAFLMSVPVMIAAGLIGILDLIQIPDAAAFLQVMAAGFLTAAVVGYLTIRWLLGFVSKRSFYPFAIYCVVFATLTLLFGLLIQSSHQPVKAQSTDITRVSISSSLGWMVPLMEVCAREQNDFYLFYMDNPSSKLDDTDLVIQFGDLVVMKGQGVVLGSDTISLIINPSSVISSLRIEEIRSILNGTITEWPEGVPIKLLVYYPGSELNRLIMKKLDLQETLASGARIAYQPNDVVLNVSQDPNAIGFIPSRVVDDSVQVVNIEGYQRAELPTNIFTFFKGELNDSQKSWLSCVKHGMRSN